jgi:hypothetical protein
MDDGAILEVERPRSAVQLIGATFSLYRRFPWLFFVLAAVVVVPYDAISLLGGREGPLQGPARAVFDLVLFVADFSVVLPLISALHVHAIDDVRRGRRPEVGSVARRGLTTLPVVSAAAAISWLGIMAGFLALIIPGVLLFLRWSVVAQAAALGSETWGDALQRSRSLTGGLYPHVFALFLLVVLITSVPDVVLTLAFGLHRTVALLLVRTAVAVATSSFTALAIGFLYFDLSARLSVEGPRPPVEGPSAGVSLSGRVVEPTGHPLDPASWRDEDRPRGWYIDPGSPHRMRYWAADGKSGWSTRSAKTPKETQKDWWDFKRR